MLRCNEIVRILSSEEELPWMKQAQLRLHLAMCKHCSRYAVHLRSMGRAAKELFVRNRPPNPKEIEKLEGKIIETHSKKINS